MASMYDLDIVWLNAMLAQIPLKMVYSPKQWQKSVNMMLEKASGNNDVTKSQIIHIFKADFNFNNKWLRKTVIGQAKMNNLIAQEQSGSQKAKG